MSAGFGPARIASMHSSVTCWIAGRRLSTRLKVNGLDSIRRNRVCSSASEVNTERGRLSTVESMCSFQWGKPSIRSSTLTRASANNSRATSWPGISQGVLPSQIRTRDSGFAGPRSSTCGGGANGQRASRSIGYSGMSAAVSAVPVVSVSDINFSSFLDVDCHGRAGRGCLADVYGLVCRGVVVEQDDDTVIVPLVEKDARIEHALTRRHTLVLVH